MYPLNISHCLIFLLLNKVAIDNQQRERKVVLAQTPNSRIIIEQDQTFVNYLLTKRC